MANRVSNEQMEELFDFLAEHPAIAKGVGLGARFKEAVDKQFVEPYIIMAFKRIWDSSCPREWDRWEQNGITYVIQDLPPEDDEEALKILLDDFLPDALLLTLSDCRNDQESVQAIYDDWREGLKQRMSLACYTEKDGHRRLVALNVCILTHKDDKKRKIVGKKRKNVYDALEYAKSKANSLEILELDLALTDLALVVIKDCRGAKLGSKVLAAREPMCRFLGIKGDTSRFTSVAAQKSAERAGFKSVLEIPIKEFAEIGLDYPKDDERLIKIMVKRYE